jgi:arylsulfatase A-like enzyme
VAAIEDVLDVLLDPALEPIVDMVLLKEGTAVEAHAVDGSVRIRPQGVLSAGRDPLGDQATDRFAPLAAERANLHPTRAVNSYPYGYEMARQLFDHPAAPDLCVIHSAAHNWAEAGGHLGEHGSLGVVQARAPFVIAGRGVRSRGRVPRACRLVDVAPTVAELMGIAPLGDGRHMSHQDGRVLDDVLIGDERPDHVVGFLFDGCNPNVLYAMADAGEAPNVARLMAMGTTFEHGAMASLPTVTLANHTSVLTGAHPGHHGILHNAWFARASGTAPGRTR